MKPYSPMDLRGLVTVRDVSQELNKVQNYLRQVSRAFVNVIGVDGNPARSADPPDLTPNPFDKFFYLPGRAGGQLAHGDISSGGILTLSSTAHATKGKIYFGQARRSAYDDLNARLGLKTTSPSAVLHVKGEPPGSLFYYPSAIVSSNGGWAAAGDATGPVCIDEVTPDNDTTFIFNIAPSANAQDVYRIIAATPPVTTGHYLRIRARKTVGAARVLPFTLINGDNSAVICTGSITLTGSYDTYYKDGTNVPVALTSGEQAVITNYANIHIKFGNLLGWAGGYAQDDIRVTQCELELPSSGGGLGGGKTAIFQAVTSQNETLSEWQNSSGTALLSVDVSGKFIVQAGGAFQFIPGAGTSKILVSDASGNMTLQNPNLFGGSFGDLVGSPSAGALIYRNLANTQWNILAAGSNGQFLTLAAGLPAWATISTAAGWTDAGTVVHLTTSTDQVGIGTTTPNARLNVTNTNAANVIVLQLTGAAAQTAALIQASNSNARNQMSLIGATLNLGNATDTSVSAVITFGQNNASFGGPIHTKLNFGENNNNLSDPNTTADQVGVAGARLYAYKDSTGVFDSAYGQSFTEAWVLAGPNSVPYVFYTGQHGVGLPYKRVEWSGTGDQQNYGRIAIRKSTGAGGSTPELRLEETGAGANFTALRAAASITTDNTYVFPAAIANGIFNNAVSGSTGTLSMLTAVRGDIIYGNSTPAWARLTAPATASVLGHNATDAAWITRPTTRVIWLATQHWSDAGMGTAVITNGSVGGLQVSTGWLFDTSATYVIDTTIVTPTDVSGSVQWFVVWSTDLNEVGANWVPFLNYGNLSGAIPAGTSISSVVSTAVSPNQFITTAIGSPVAHGPSVPLTLRFARIPGSGSDDHIGSITVYAIYGVYTPVY